MITSSVLSVVALSAGFLIFFTARLLMSLWGSVDAEFRNIIRESERQYWQDLESQNWMNQLDQDEQAVQDFLNLGDR